MTKTPAMISEDILVKSIREGDNSAFQVLFTRYEAQVYRFCVLILGNIEVAHDIYQETFFKFYLACRDGKEIRNVKGWLISKTRSLCLNHLRDSKRRIELLQSRQEQPWIKMDVGTIGVEDYLQEALYKLPDHYREALLLFEVEGYSYKEIAEIQDVDFHAVKNRIYQAKRSLQKILGPILGDENSNRPRKS